MPEEEYEHEERSLRRVHVIVEVVDDRPPLSPEDPLGDFEADPPPSMA